MKIKNKFLGIIIFFLIYSFHIPTYISDYKIKNYTKINYIFVVDTSLSMTHYFKSVINSLSSFIQKLKIGDVVTIITFDSDVNTFIYDKEIKNISDIKFIQKEVKSLYVKGEYTYLALAVKKSREIMKYFKNKYKYRRGVILIFSDNRDDPPPWARGNKRINLIKEAKMFKRINGWMIFTLSPIRRNYSRGADVSTMLGSTYIPYKKNFLKIYINIISIFSNIFPYIEIIIFILLFLLLISKLNEISKLLSYLLFFGTLFYMIIFPVKFINYLNTIFSFLWNILSAILNIFIKYFIYNRIRFFILIIIIILSLIYKKRFQTLFKNIRFRIKLLFIKDKEKKIKLLKKRSKKLLLKYFIKTKDIKNILHLLQKSKILKKEMNKYFKKIKNGKKYILIVGSFSSGKTFFLKSITDLEIFTSKSIPTTHIIQYLKYGKEKLKINYTSGNSEIIRKMDKIDYDFLEKNKYIIESIEIYTNKNKKLKKLIFVDTPGSEAIEENFALNEEVLFLTDIILYFIEATKPLSEKDVLHIKELVKYHKKIIFVITKIDILDDNEENIAEIGNFVYKNIKNSIKEIKSPEIVFISSKYYTLGKTKKDEFLIFESNIVEFLKYINSYPS